TAEDRRLRKRRKLDTRRPDIDAIDGGSVDLRRRIEALRRCADDLEILLWLERHFFRDWHPRRVGSEVAIFQLSPGWWVTHFAALRVTGRRVDVPALGRRRHEHGPCGRAGLAQRLPSPAHRIRVA